MKTPDQYQGNFIDLCFPSGTADSDATQEISSQNWSVKHEFENIATQAPLHVINWRNDSGITEPSSYKLVHLE